MQVELPNRRATRFLAHHLATLLRGGDLVILSGALGAGKTFFVRALCRKLGLPASERVTSPTFTLAREIDTVPPLMHADLYRIQSAADVENLGLAAERDAGRALLVEWGGPHERSLGGDALHVDISLSPRRAAITATGPRSSAMLQSLQARSVAQRPQNARRPQEEAR